MKINGARRSAERNRSSFEWLLHLRWLALAGQVLILSLASGWLHLPLNLPPLITLFIFIACTNFALSYLPEALRERSTTLGIILVADLFLLTLLLYCSGGPENPFSILYLLHVVLSAVLLDRKSTLWMAALSIVLFAFLFQGAAPISGLQQAHFLQAHPPQSHRNHLLGMWVAYSLVALMSAYCITRISAELRRKERETERLILNQKQLASLTTLAAGAAHELSTPLGTIAIIVGELESALSKRGNAAPLLDDIQLLKSQVARCKEIISKMSKSSGDVPGEGLSAIRLADFASSLRSAFHERFGDAVRVETAGLSDPCVLPANALTQALSSLVKNSIEASVERSTVQIRMEAKDGYCEFSVTDHGCGMREEVLSRVGEPFFSTKGGGGMGLGIFLARLTAQSLGGSLTFRSTEGKGTEATISFPMEQYGH